MLIIGLMSGTSHDAIDAALVDVSDKSARLLGHHKTPMPSKIKSEIASAMQGMANAESICRLNYRLGELFAKSALDCARSARTGMRDIKAIASHGQTICHIPPKGNRMGATMQIAEAAVIAARTGVMTISDFRAADVACMGQGAPLVPMADYLLFKRLAPCCVHNLGGISNVTVVDKNIDKVFAFDTGPANCLMDEAMMKFFNKPCDLRGATARRGTPDIGLLGKLLRHPYFKRRPPKSTGRELFNLDLVYKHIGPNKIKPADLMSTLAHLTARSIGMAYRDFITPKTKARTAIFSGGGVKNDFLMALIRKELSGIEVKTIDEFGIASSAKEAASFAILAYETIQHRPSNLTAATGANRPAILGKISHPPL